MPEWAKELSCAVTVCDTDGIVIYQNEKSKAVFAAYGDMTGKNLKNCHNPESWTIIQKLMAENSSNSYTIEKNGSKKLIHQTPWYLGTNIAGLVELSIELPSTLPHFIR